MAKRITETERAARIADKHHRRWARLANRSARRWVKTGDGEAFNGSASRGMAAWVADDIAKEIRAGRTK